MNNREVSRVRGTQVSRHRGNQASKHRGTSKGTAHTSNSSSVARWKSACIAVSIVGAIVIAGMGYAIYAAGKGGIDASLYNLKTESKTNDVIDRDYNPKSDSTLNNVVTRDYNPKSDSKLNTEIEANYNLKRESITNTELANGYKSNAIVTDNYVPKADLRINQIYVFDGAAKTPTPIGNVKVAYIPKAHQGDDLSTPSIDETINSNNDRPDKVPTNLQRGHVLSGYADDTILIYDSQDATISTLDLIGKFSIPDNAATTDIDESVEGKIDLKLLFAQDKSASQEFKVEWEPLEGGDINIGEVASKWMSSFAMLDESEIEYLIDHTDRYGLKLWIGKQNEVQAYQYDFLWTTGSEINLKAALTNYPTNNDTITIGEYTEGDTTLSIVAESDDSDTNPILLKGLRFFKR